VNHDGYDDVVLGASVNGHVKLIDGLTGAEFGSFFAYGGYTGGVRVAVADVNGDGYEDIITASDLGAHVKLFDGRSITEIRSFLSYPSFTGGVFVAGLDDPRIGGPDPWKRGPALPATGSVLLMPGDIEPEAPNLVCISPRDVEVPSRPR